MDLLLVQGFFICGSGRPFIKMGRPVPEPESDLTNLNSSVGPLRNLQIRNGLAEPEQKRRRSGGCDQ